MPSSSPISQQILTNLPSSEVFLRDCFLEIRRSHDFHESKACLDQRQAPARHQPSNCVPTRASNANPCVFIPAYLLFPLHIRRRNTSQGSRDVGSIPAVFCGAVSQARRTNQSGRWDLSSHGSASVARQAHMYTYNIRVVSLGNVLRQGHRRMQPSPRSSSSRVGIDLRHLRRQIAADDWLLSDGCTTADSDEHRSANFLFGARQNPAGRLPLANARQR